MLRHGRETKPCHPVVCTGAAASADLDLARISLRAGVRNGLATYGITIDRDISQPPVHPARNSNVPVNPRPRSSRVCEARFHGVSY